ncbi:MAG: cyclic pyranopterin monophosphate synthase MoaC [Planctomycetota bacterium]|jgi:cyclic pyranopterin phosphate synthase
MAEPTHLDAAGRARMVDVSGKPETVRRARAACRVRLGAAAATAMREGTAGKGDVVAAARLAGIAAAKRTSELIPLCHPLRTSAVSVDLAFEDETTLGITAEAALTVYDMLKALDKGITITGLRLLEKSGGKSGHWTRKD